MNSTFNGFRNDFAFLSNFHPVHLTFEGERYTSSEHAYQSAKTLDPWEKRMIREAPDPGRAKKLGKGVKIRPDWESIKLSVMETILRSKFENPWLRSLLIDTGELELVETNTWSDTFWGVCNGVGENNLGKLLMKIRDEVRIEVEQEQKDFKQ